MFSESRSELKSLKSKFKKRIGKYSDMVKYTILGVHTVTILHVVNYGDVENPQEWDGERKN